MPKLKGPPRASALWDPVKILSDQRVYCGLLFVVWLRCVFSSPEPDVGVRLWTFMTHFRIPALLGEDDAQVLYMLLVGFLMKAFACVAREGFSLECKFHERFRNAKLLCVLWWKVEMSGAAHFFFFALCLYELFLEKTVLKTLRQMSGNRSSEFVVSSYLDVDHLLGLLFLITIRCQSYNNWILFHL